MNKEWFKTTNMNLHTTIEDFEQDYDVTIKTNWEIKGDKDISPVQRHLQNWFLTSHWYTHRHNTNINTMFHYKLQLDSEIWRQFEETVSTWHVKSENSKSNDDDKQWGAKTEKVSVCRNSWRSEDFCSLLHNWARISSCEMLECYSSHVSSRLVFPVISEETEWRWKSISQSLWNQVGEARMLWQQLGFVTVFRPASYLVI